MGNAHSSNSSLKDARAAVADAGVASSNQVAPDAGANKGPLRGLGESRAVAPNPSLVQPQQPPPRQQQSRQPQPQARSQQRQARGQPQNDDVDAMVDTLLQDIQSPAIAAPSPRKPPAASPWPEGRDSDPIVPRAPPPYSPYRTPAAVPAPSPSSKPAVPPLSSSPQPAASYVGSADPLLTRTNGEVPQRKRSDASGAARPPLQMSAVSPPPPRPRPMPEVSTTGQDGVTDIYLDDGTPLHLRQAKRQFDRDKFKRANRGSTDDGSMPLSPATSTSVVSASNGSIASPHAAFALATEVGGQRSSSVTNSTSRLGGPGGGGALGLSPGPTPATFASPVIPASRGPQAPLAQPVAAAVTVLSALDEELMNEILMET
ncbi:hypothetical protein H9P43_003447 [Blastocladiella emersonii ATCC 22665]|nr:hypothetical protein H9P43_003447 [Blastocladiella emersonii ATCC 22665]